ncbi:MAG: response regulator, partial [Gemmatimonadetes bacterium]|nr:response regulator [Gemmatimonadota bacterium]
TEVTASKQQYLDLQSAHAFNEALLQSASDSIVATDTSGLITSFNAAAESLLGARAEDVVNRHSPALWHVPEEVVARAEELSRELGRPVEPGIDAFVAKVKETRQPDVREWTCIRTDGTRFPVRLAVTPVIDANGAMIGYIGIAHDITALKAHQQALADAARAAEAATAAKSQFLANMSHEIRTPLNGVLGMTSFLLGTPLSDTQREYAETIQRSGHALLDVINEVLDFSKIEAGRLEMEDIDFAPRELAEGVAEIVAVSARQRGIELVVDVADDVPLVQRGDPTRVRQVITNLLANAVKFSSEGSTVVVRVTTMWGAADPEGNERATVRYEVEDHGIGIEAQALRRLFAPFTQADATTTRRFGGTGLGLAICKRLTEMMGGEIGAESVLGQGSTFWFTLPGPFGRATVEAVSPRLTGRRVLCVEPNATVRRVLTHLLEREGAQVTPVASADAALTPAMAAEPFDTVMSACTMPDLSGPDLVRRFRERVDRPAPRTILLSSRGDATPAAGAACADVVLLKPVGYERLVDAIVRPRAALTTAVPAAIDRPPLAGLRVLVAEDDPVNMIVIRTMLGNFGADVVSAETGREAVERFDDGVYDVVLMDFHMPEMDGLEAARMIRAAEASR